MQVSDFTILGPIMFLWRRGWARMGWDFNENNKLSRKLMLQTLEKTTTLFQGVFP